MGQKVAKQRMVVFHNAVRNGNMDKVKEMLEEGVLLEDQDDVFGTPLHEAACFDRIEIAEVLIKQKADINLPMKHHGDTPLCVACRKGYLPHVDLFVRSGVKINNTGKGGATPLHCALENKHEEVAKFLIGASASVSILDGNGMSPMHIACKNLCKRSAELILSSNTSNTTIPAGTVPVATPAVAATLNSHDKSNMTPLMYACQVGDEQFVDFLLKSGAKTKYDMGRSAPLHVTTSIDIAKLLIANGADINARDENYCTPLHHACTNINGAELVGLFLAHNADTSPHDNQTRATPLHAACKHGAYGNADLLLKHNAHPNAVDSHKNTPLHVASSLGYTGIAKLLVDNGGDPNAINNDGMTPTQLAMASD